ncbi:uncharacterized protein EKO05_0005697 [Ascochyta rabiei]|nr:uncharacterized protein EKO05_0005697 [Ascochyta rabiei]UPX15241.1 hypothetical protein EKO05_0005697 [Ascochyta rabiei]
MADIDCEDLAVWRGPFSWDGLLLRLHIRTVIQDYDAEDPRTWPLIKDVVQTEVNYDYRQTKHAPRFLAYEQSLMENLVTHRPLVNKVSCRPNLASHQIKAMFADYPFNFDRYGEIRKYLHLPAGELEEWMKLMRGTIPDSRYLPDISPQATQAPKNADGMQKERSVPSDTAFKHTTETSLDRKASASAMAQTEFKVVQHQPEGAIETAMDTLMTAHTRSLHSATQRTRALQLLVNDHYQEAEGRAQVAEAKIQILGEQLERQRKELEAAKRETVETNEKIIWVWNIVQRLDDGSASEKKSIKVEE